MNPNNTPPGNSRKLALTDLAQHCALETELYYRGQPYDPQFCFEMFRRAFIEADQHAWDRIYTQYQLQAVRWVQRDPLFPFSSQEAQDFVNLAFAKMWTALTPGKFARLPDLKSALAYLRICIKSVILDDRRIRKWVELGYLDEVDPDQGGTDSGNTPEDHTLQAIEREKLWRLVEQQLHNENERLVIVAIFVYGMKAQEIYKQFPNRFSNVAEIHRVRQNVLDRLRRNLKFRDSIR
ncbi:MAG: sigma-70 family RNA polymerase sigma factor [Chloroflexi bacterium]|nr:sigma-70 family RNA polymerase sigma factor [Chloroflexota bacterium]